VASAKTSSSYLLFSLLLFARRLRLWLPVVVYAALIYYLSAQTDPLPAVTGAVWDKALHAAGYGVLGLLMCRAWRGSGYGWTRAVALAILMTSAYAVSDEWHQSFVPGRQSDWHDWIADTLGGAAGVVVFCVIAASTRLLARVPSPPRA